MKYLFIHLIIQDGERRHDHKIVHITTGKNINFAAERYAANYWGKSHSRNCNWWCQWGGEIAVKVARVKELTEKEYKILNKYI